MEQGGGARGRRDHGLEEVIEGGEHPMVDPAGSAIDHDPQAVYLRRAEMIADAQPDAEGLVSFDPEIEAGDRAGAGPSGSFPAIDLTGVPARAEEALPHVDEHRRRGLEDAGLVAFAGFRIERLAIGTAPACGVRTGGGDEASIDDGARLGETLLFGGEAGRSGKRVVDLERATRRRAAESGGECGEEVVELFDKADDVDRCQSSLEEVEKRRGGILAAALAMEFGEPRPAEGEVVSDGVAEDRGTGEREEGSEACAGHGAEAAVTIVTAGDEGVIPASDHPPFGMQPGDRISEDDNVEGVAQKPLPVVDTVRIVEELGAEDGSEGVASRVRAPLPRHERLHMRRPFVRCRSLEELQERRPGAFVDVMEDDAGQHGSPPDQARRPCPISRASITALPAAASTASVASVHKG
jgi:hypothetical protein